MELGEACLRAGPPPQFPAQQHAEQHHDGACRKSPRRGEERPLPPIEQYIDGRRADRHDEGGIRHPGEGIFALDAVEWRGHDERPARLFQRRPEVQILRKIGANTSTVPLSLRRVDENMSARVEQQQRAVAADIDAGEEILDIGQPSHEHDDAGETAIRTRQAPAEGDAAVAAAHAALERLTYKRPASGLSRCVRK